MSKNRAGSEDSGQPVEEMLEEAQLRWTDLFGGMQLIVLGLQTDGRVNFANPFFLSLTGYEHHEVIGADWFSKFLPPGDTYEVRSVFSDVLAEEGQYHVNPILTKDGRKRFISWFNTTLHDREGHIVGTLSVGDDVTERAKATARFKAIGEILHDILVETPVEEVLNSLAEYALELLTADLATVVLPIGDGELVIAAAAGAQAHELRGTVFSADESISGQVMRSVTTEVIEDASVDDRDSQPIVSLGGFGPAIFVPLTARYQPLGTLGVTNHCGRWDFSKEDVELLESFASQASIALEYSRAQEQLRRMIVVDERERVARDLHDVVIQRLFAIGLSLKGTQNYSSDNPLVSQRLEETVSELDDTVTSIRSTIFALTMDPGDGNLRAQLLKVCYDAAGSLGFQPRIRFSGLVDSLVPEELAHDVIAVAREALSNIARHAKATRAIVDLQAGSELILHVSDNGIGISSRNGRESGLANLKARALSHGGTFSIKTGEEDGTSLEWRVPLLRVDSEQPANSAPQGELGGDGARA